MKRYQTHLLMTALLCLLALTTSGCFLSGLFGRVAAQSLSEFIDLVTANISGNGTAKICFETGIGVVDCTYVLEGEELTTSIALIMGFGILGVFIDPLILQVPAGAAAITGTFDTGAGPQNLAITTANSFLAQPGTEVFAEAGHTFIIVDFPGNVPSTGFNFNLQFQFQAPVGQYAAGLPLKAMFTGKVQGGGQTFYPPMLPCTTSFASVPMVTIPVTGNPVSLASQLFPLFRQNLGCDKVEYDFTSVAGSPLDHFQCYKTRDSRGSICGVGSTMNSGATCEVEEDCGGVEDETAFCVPKGFPKGVEVSLADQFEAGQFKVLKPLRLCAPADKNGEAINDAATHLRSYQIKPVPKQTPHVPQRNLRIENQFHPALGELRVDTIKPDWLLVPTAKGLTDPVPPPDPANHHVEHFKCYKVKPTKGAPKFKPVLDVTVTDQFNQTREENVSAPKRLCTPVEKNGEPIRNSAVHLMCYQVKAVKEPPQPKPMKVLGLFLNNQLAPERVDTTTPDQFCVPSTKILP